MIVETCLLISETASVASMVYEKSTLCSIVPLLSGSKPGHALDSSIATSLGGMLVEGPSEIDGNKVCDGAKLFNSAVGDIIVGFDEGSPELIMVDGI